MQVIWKCNFFCNFFQNFQTYGGMMVSPVGCVTDRTCKGDRKSAYILFWPGTCLSLMFKFHRTEAKKVDGTIPLDNYHDRTQNDGLEYTCTLTATIQPRWYTAEAYQMGVGLPYKTRQVDFDLRKVWEGPSSLSVAIIGTPVFENLQDSMYWLWLSILQTIMRKWKNHWGSGWCQENYIYVPESTARHQWRSWKYKEKTTPTTK